MDVLHGPTHQKTGLDNADGAMLWAARCSVNRERERLKRT